MFKFILGICCISYIFFFYGKIVFNFFFLSYKKKDLYRNFITVIKLNLFFKLVFNLLFYY